MDPMNADRGGFDAKAEAKRLARCVHAVTDGYDCCGTAHRLERGLLAAEQAGFRRGVKAAAKVADAKRLAWREDTHLPAPTRVLCEGAVQVVRDEIRALIGEAE